MLPRLLRVLNERPHDTEDKGGKAAKTEASRGRGEPNPSTSGNTRKRIREPTASPEESAVKKPVEMGPKASNKEEEWVEVPKKPRRARSEAVLIKPAEGMSYASILRELRKRVNPDELGATVQGIRETRSKDLLVELKCFRKSRGRLDTAIKEAVGSRGTVRHLIPRIEVEIADLDPSIGAGDKAHGLLKEETLQMLSLNSLNIH